MCRKKTCGSVFRKLNETLAYNQLTFVAPYPGKAKCALPKQWFKFRFPPSATSVKIAGTAFDRLPCSFNHSFLPTRIKVVMLHNEQLGNDKTCFRPLFIYLVSIFLKSKIFKMWNSYPFPRSKFYTFDSLLSFSQKSWEVCGETSTISFIFDNARFRKNYFRYCCILQMHETWFTSEASCIS